jgi:hypothetical protein
MESGETLSDNSQVDETLKEEGLFEFSDEVMLAHLYEYLNCNDEAGGDLWYQSNLYFACHDLAIRIGAKHIKILQGGDFRYLKERLPEFADELLYEIDERLKPRSGDKPGKRPENFESWENFTHYLNRSMKGIINKIIKAAQSTSLDEDVYSDKESGVSQGPTRGEIIADTTTPLDLLIDEDEQRRRSESANSLARSLLDAFQQRLESRRALRQLFDQLMAFQHSACKDNPIEATTNVINFLNVGFEHYPEMRKHFVIDKGMNKNTYSSNNRRLRIEWEDFRGGPGAEICRQFEETGL